MKKLFSLFTVLLLLSVVVVPVLLTAGSADAASLEEAIAADPAAVELAGSAQHHGGQVAGVVHKVAARGFSAFTRVDPLSIVAG